MDKHISVKKGIIVDSTSLLLAPMFVRKLPCFVDSSERANFRSTLDIETIVFRNKK